MRSCLIVIILAAGLLAGCNREERITLPEATLEGTITLKGRAVPHAMVVIAGSSQSAQGFADKDGKFQIPNCPAGQVKIGVNTDAGRGNMMGAIMSASVAGKKSEAPTFVDVPKKYFDPSTSGITAEVTDPKGVTKFDIKLD